jgi:mercuric ion binding protein
MKKLIASLLLFVAAVCLGNNQDDSTKQTRKGHAMISLPTMQCATCVETIQKAVEKVEGVQSIHIDLKTKMAHVSFDSGKTSLEKIEKAIAAVGYDANKTRRDEKAYAGLPKCCQENSK